MAEPSKRRVNRRTFLKGAAAAAAIGTAAVGTGVWLGSQSRVSRSAGKKVIVIGVDGMDPRLCERMLAAGQLPNLARMRAAGGFSDLATSVPPQSPVAWATFINGAGPGSHGIFDFFHRHPEQPLNPFYGASETLPGSDHSLEIGDYSLPLFPSRTVLRRQGVPFWDFLDEAGVSSTFYDLPCNFPPSPSQHGHHRCLCGMGTTDLLGGFGTYQYFAEDVPPEGKEESGGKRTRLVFSGETARASLIGPVNGQLRQPQPVTAEFLVHRDREANAAVVEIQGRRILLRAGGWSRWVRLNFEFLPVPLLPGSSASGICRFYLQKVRDNFQLFVSPINIDPSAPAVPISEPGSFVQDLSGDLGLFYTTGFQEEYNARKNGVFADDEYARQADMVLQERLALFENAVHNYDDGLLFFYFSSSDLQSHMFWWDSDDPHPFRNPAEAQRQFRHVQNLYRRLDTLVGDLFDRYGSQATILVMSDHGFANFGRQFHLNSWLRDEGYLQPAGCMSIMRDADWPATAAYGLGLNGLYLNLKGREPDGRVEPGEQANAMIEELKEKLEAVVDPENDDARVIRTVYRADQIYSGSAMALAPDLIVGYSRGYRASWETSLGNLVHLNEPYLSKNEDAWSADHCADALEVPGVLFCNRPLRLRNPNLMDVAPSILAEFGLATPSSMVGRNLF